MRAGTAAARRLPRLPAARRATGCDARTQSLSGQIGVAGWLGVLPPTSSLLDKEAFEGPDAPGCVGPSPFHSLRATSATAAHQPPGARTGSRVRDHINTAGEVRTIKRPAWPGWCNGPGRT